MHLLILENLPERQKTTGTHPGGKDTSSCHFGELILPCGHWHWKALIWNPPLSLLTSGHSPTNQPVGLLLGCFRPSNYWARTQPHLPEGRLP